MHEQHPCGALSQLIRDRPLPHPTPGLLHDMVGQVRAEAGEGPGMLHTHVGSQDAFPYEALVAYQRGVDNPTMNCEMGALSQCPTGQVSA